MITIRKSHIKFKKHKRTAYKGEYGRVLLVGGSKEYVGAVALTGLAALRSGCDWVTIAAPEKVSWAINALSPDLVTYKCKGEYLSEAHYKNILQLAAKHDVVIIGNGLGLGKSTIALVKKLVKQLSRIKKAMVIDADALKVINLKTIDHAVLTPHAKEFALLLKHAKLTEKTFQHQLKQNIVIRKGPVDKIVSKHKIYLNKTGNERMSVAGTGDVLAGLVGGFLAQGCTPLQSSINAAYINGKVADQLKRSKKYAYIASDIVKDLKKIKMQSQKTRKN